MMVSTSAFGAGRSQFKTWQGCKLYFFNYPPENKAKRDVANLTERKNPQTPVYGVK